MAQEVHPATARPFRARKHGHEDKIPATAPAQLVERDTGDGVRVARHPPFHERQHLARIEPHRRTGAKCRAQPPRFVERPFVDDSVGMVGRDRRVKSAPEAGRLDDAAPPAHSLGVGVDPGELLHRVRKRGVGDYERVPHCACSISRMVRKTQQQMLRILRYAAGPVLVEYALYNMDEQSP